ncbi:MAG: AbiV family abortive infection protein [Chitinophagales bacterium]
MKNKLREKYEKIFENGVSLIESAQKVAEINNYGTATSLLILGLEELIKYQVFLNNLGEEDVFEQSEFKKVFSDHKTKHSLISELQEATFPEFTERFLEYVFQLATNQTLTENNLKIEQNRFKENGVYFNSLYQEIKLSKEEILDFQKWLKHANSLKNKGFYVSLKKNQWTFPSQISKKEFKNALKYALAVKNQVEVSKSLDLTEQEFIDFLNG